VLANLAATFLTNVLFGSFVGRATLTSHRCLGGLLFFLDQGRVKGRDWLFAGRSGSRRRCSRVLLSATTTPKAQRNGWDHSRTCSSCSCNARSRSGRTLFWSGIAIIVVTATVVAVLLLLGLGLVCSARHGSWLARWTTLWGRHDAKEEG
jgi:hypothetical protein